MWRTQAAVVSSGIRSPEEGMFDVWVGLEEE